MTEVTTIFLVWTLWAGVPYSVDAFIDKESCLEATTLWEENAQKAREAKPEIMRHLSIVGCIPLEIVPPPAPEARKESS